MTPNKIEAVNLLNKYINNVLPEILEQLEQVKRPIIKSGASSEVKKILKPYTNINYKGAFICCYFNDFISDTDLKKLTFKISYKNESFQINKRVFHIVRGKTFFDETSKHYNKIGYAVSPFIKQHIFSYDQYKRAFRAFESMDQQIRELERKKESLNYKYNSLLNMYYISKGEK